MWLSVVGESHLEEAETTFAVLQVGVFGVEVVQSPAESWRLGLLEGLHLRRLAAGLQRAAVTAASLVPVLICSVFGGDTGSWVS